MFACVCVCNVFERVYVCARVRACARARHVCVHARAFVRASLRVQIVLCAGACRVCMFA